MQTQTHNFTVTPTPLPFKSVSRGVIDRKGAQLAKRFHDKHLKKYFSIISIPGGKSAAAPPVARPPMTRWSALLLLLLRRREEGARGGGRGGGRLDEGVGRASLYGCG